MAILHSVLEAVALVGMIIFILCFNFMFVMRFIYKIIKRYKLIECLGYIALVMGVTAIFDLCIIFREWSKWVTSVILGPIFILYYIWILIILRKGSD